MQYTLLGNTGLTVSRLAFGAMTFSAGNKAIAAVYKPFTHGQMYYSLVGRDVERDVIPMMRRYGLGLTVWSPLASGFLSGKYTRQTSS